MASTNISSMTALFGGASWQERSGKQVKTMSKCEVNLISGSLSLSEVGQRVQQLHAQFALLKHETARQQHWSHNYNNSNIAITISQRHLRQCHCA